MAVRLIACLSLLTALAVVPARADTGAIVIVSRSQYVPGDDALAPVVMLAGKHLDFRNMDKLSTGSTHSITSDGNNTLPSGALFDSGVLQAGESGIVDMSALPPGTYGFHCTVHEDVMHGRLIIV